MTTTTLNEIKAEQPCSDIWEALLMSLNKTQADNEVLSFNRILEVLGIYNAAWFVRVLDFKDQALFRAEVAESILDIFEEEYPEDDRPRLAIGAIKDYHKGSINKDQLAAATQSAAKATQTAHTEASYFNDQAAYYADNLTDYNTFNDMSCRKLEAALSARAANLADLVIVKNLAYSKPKLIEQLFIKHFCQ